MTPKRAWSFISNEQDADVAIDKLFDYVDDLLLKGEFTEVDAFLQIVDVEELSKELAVAVLSITFTAKEKLEAREELYYRIKKELQSYFDSAEIDSLLKGLH